MTILVQQLLERAQERKEQIERLRTENRKLLKDANRYRWLRDHHIGDDPESINLSPAKSKGLSAAIDAAMQSQIEGGEV